MSSGPHAIHMENRDASMIRTTEIRLCGHCSGGPRGVDAQSTAARSRPTEPPAANTEGTRTALRASSSTVSIAAGSYEASWGGQGTPPQGPTLPGRGGRRAPATVSDTPGTAPS